MEEQTLGTYQGSPYARMVFATRAKVGKTVTLMGNALGAMPWQRMGGIVSHPSHFHVVTADSDAMSGVREFLVEQCEVALEDIKGVKAYNMEKDVRRAAEGRDPYNHDLFLQLRETRDLIASRVRPGETHAVLLSSVTGFARGMERALMGEPTGQGDSGKGYGSRDLWQLFKTQMYDFQDFFQALDAHVLWEAHLSEFTKGDPKNPITEEKLAISGAAGNASSGLTFNASHVFRITRKNTRYKSKDGKTADGKAIPAKLTKAGKNEWPVDEVYFDTDVSGSFVANGRMVASRLERSEFDMTRMFKKLGLKVGGWKPKA
jgi:hypothetical protein